MYVTRLCAKHKEGNDAHVTTSVTLSGSVTSYTLALPRSDADYDVTLTATSAQGDHPQACRAVRTLPYVHCECVCGCVCGCLNLS